jgi:putative tryptophan/tyrosine transport system substrate-binding protein
MNRELGEHTYAGQRVRDRYRIVRELGSGSFGTVYAAEDEVTAQRVAVRFLPRALATAPGVVRAVQSMGRSIAAASASHSGLVRVLEIAQAEPGQPVAVMELVEGRPLSDLMAAGKRLDLASARRWALDLGAAVETLHNIGFVHGALRPRNVMVLPDGNVKVMDVELAGLLDASAPNVLDASPAEYLAPEQIRGAPTSEKTDIYALGAIIYEMFSGAPPFRAATREAVLASHLTKSPRPMNHRRAMSSAERTVMQALEKDPDRRPWIDEILNGLWGEVTAPTTVPGARRWKRTAAIAGGVAGLAAIVAVGTWAMLGREPSAARSAVVPPAPQVEPSPVGARTLTSAPASAPVKPLSVPEQAPPRAVATTAAAAAERSAPPADAPVSSAKAPAETAKATPPVTPPAPRVASVPSGNRGSVSVLAEVQSQRRTYRVGWLDSGRATAQYQDLVKQALVGYPRDVTFEYRSADGQAARLQEFATELVQLKVDVMFAVGNGAILAARQATSTIPIVMVGSDAARPDDSSANVTGVTYSSAELARRWVSLLKEIGPLSRVAVVYGADSAGRAELATLQAAASDAGAKIQAYGVNESDALGGLFARPSAERAEAIIVPGGPTTLAHLSRIVDLAGRASVPTIYGSSEFVEAGGLLSYGPSTPAMYRRAGGYIGKILGPTNPRDLPIEQPSRFELVVNLKTARALGLTLPSSLVLRADRILQ